MLEVYRIGWPRVKWVGPAYMGHNPTLKKGPLQYKIGQPVWLLSITVYFWTEFFLDIDSSDLTDFSWEYSGFLLVVSFLPQGYVWWEFHPIFSDAPFFRQMFVCV